MTILAARSSALGPVVGGRLRLVGTRIRTGLVLIMMLLLAAPALAGAALPRGFVYLRDIDPTIVQDIRYAGSHNFVGRPIKGYLAGECILSVAAAKALKTVQGRLAEKKLSLIVWDCYRPKRAVDDFWQWSKDSAHAGMKAEFFPRTDKQKLFALGYLAQRSAHSRGSAVDLGMVPIPGSSAPPPGPSQPLKACTAPKGERFEDGTVDLGTGYDCLDVLATTSNARVGAAALRNRQTLKSQMEAAGFRPYAREWWHFELANEPFHGDGFDFEVSASRSTDTPGPLTKQQSDALDAYDRAVDRFERLLRQRRAQIDSNQPLPNLPGQALYLARNDMISAYKDLTDAVPSRIGAPNKFGIPPAYLDAGRAPLLDEYLKLFDRMDAPPAYAQKSDTPFKDVVDLAMAIARARGLDAADAEAAGRISLGLFFAETNGKQNIGNARSNKYKGSFQTGPSEDQAGRNKWAAIKASVAAFDPALNRRDDQEEARAGLLDHRFNHWTAVRDALMSAHADMFTQIRAIVKTLPDPIDQMKLFELIQIIPTPTRSALKSGNLVSYRISDPKIMGYLRNNSMFAFGRADRARTSANFREILDAMWLFNAKFERARAEFDEIKAGKKKG